jgi:hypothetical protein
MGVSWTHITAGLTDNNIMCIYCFGGKVFIGSMSSGVFVSNNGGWGSGLYRVETGNNHITNICCAQPSGMETINGELWAIRDYPWEIIYRDSTVVYPDSTIVYPDSTITNTDSTVVYPDSTGSSGSNPKVVMAPYPGCTAYYDELTPAIDN